MCVRWEPFGSLVLDTPLRQAVYACAHVSFARSAADASSAASAAVDRRPGRGAPAARRPDGADPAGRPRSLGAARWAGPAWQVRYWRLARTGCLVWALPPGQL